MNDNLLFRLEVAPARRIIAVSFMIALAFLLIYTAFSAPMSFGFKAVIIVVGVVCLMGARSMAQGTKRSIELREDGLFLSDGEVLTKMDNVRKVERGLFALKPAGGFAIRMYEAPGFDYAPGLYWRIGRVLGIGGVTNRGAGKAMADSLAAYLIETGQGNQQD